MIHKAGEIIKNVLLLPDEIEDVVVYMFDSVNQKRRKYKVPLKIVQEFEDLKYTNNNKYKLNINKFQKSAYYYYKDYDDNDNTIVNIPNLTKIKKKSSINILKKCEINSKYSCKLESKKKVNISNDAPIVRINEINYRDYKDKFTIKYLKYKQKYLLLKKNNNIL